MKLLMIEDNTSVAEMMAMFFQKEKWEVVNAYDGEEGLAKFKEAPDSFDIITLDLNRPAILKVTRCWDLNSARMTM